MVGGRDGWPTVADCRVNSPQAVHGENVVGQNEGKRGGRLCVETETAGLVLHACRVCVFGPHLALVTNVTDELYGDFTE